FGLSVDCSTNGRAGQPGVANLADVRTTSAVRGMPRRPRPAFKIPETSRTDDFAIPCPDSRKRHGTSCTSPGERCGDVLCRITAVLRYLTPPVQRRILPCGGHQGIDVVFPERFQANMLALQRQVFVFHFCNPGPLAIRRLYWFAATGPGPGSPQSLSRAIMSGSIGRGRLSRPPPIACVARR